MNDQIAAAAQSVLSDSLSYVLTMLGHARPRWGLYISTLGITAVAGAAFIGWNYLGESRRPYSIAATSEETALAAGHYRQPIIMELKGAVVREPL